MNKLTIYFIEKHETVVNEIDNNLLHTLWIAKS